MKMETRTKAIRIASASMLAASLLTSLSLAMVTTHAQAANLKPLPAPLANHPYGTTKTGLQIAAWGPGSNAPGNCTNPHTSEISTNSSGDAVLTTSGATGDCVDLESPHTYPTVDGYVYETYADFSNWTQWDSFWMYGSNWPTAGEIDSVEGGDGINAISYHYEGAAGPAQMSSCNDTNNCDSSAIPLTSQPKNPEISPGWHTIDISFGTCGTGCGTVDVWYDGTLYGTVSGTNVLNGGSQDDPYWIAYSTGSCDSDNGDVCNSSNGGQTGGTVTIAWLRIFT
jgi:uncharacterized membrane protein